MRKGWLIFAFLACFCFVACINNYVGPSVDKKRYPGMASGYLNGEVWETYCGAFKARQSDSTFYFFADSLSEFFMRRNGLLLFNILLNEQMQSVGNVGKENVQPYARFSIDDYDINLALYEVDTTYSNWINITKIDTVAEVIQAEFEVHLVLDEGGLPGWPDTLHFTDCRLETWFSEL